MRGNSLCFSFSHWVSIVGHSNIVYHFWAFTSGVLETKLEGGVFDYLGQLIVTPKMVDMKIRYNEG